MHKTTHLSWGIHPPFLKPKNDVVPASIPSLAPYHHEPRHRHRHRHAAAAISPPFMVTTVVAATCSWLRNRRIRYLFLFLCSPVLLVLLCVTLPFLCAAELCFRRWLWRKLNLDPDDDDRLRQCEEGCCGCGGGEEKGLLHRYLEDQLLLVGSMFECGDDEEEDEELEDEEDSRRVDDVENLDSSRIPLLR